MESQKVGHDQATNTSLCKWVQWPGSQCRFLRASALQTFRAWCPLLLVVLQEQLREGASVPDAGWCLPCLHPYLFLTHVRSPAPGSGSRKSEGCCPEAPPASPTCLEVGRPSGTSPKLELGRLELYWPTILVYWSAVWPWIGFSPFLSLISLEIKSEGHTGSSLAGSSHSKILPLTPTHFSPLSHMSLCVLRLCCSVTKLCLTLWPHGLQHARFPYPSLSLRVCSNSCPLSWWHYLTISSSAFLLSFCLQFLPASRSLQVSWLFTSGAQNIGDSVSASVLPMNIQGWFPLGLTGLISFSSRDSQESSLAPRFKSINSLALSLLYDPTLTSIHDYWKNHSFDCMSLCWQSDVSAF